MVKKEDFPIKTETIITYTSWCELMEINPSHIESILHYKRLEESMIKIGYFKQNSVGVAR